VFDFAAAFPSVSHDMMWDTLQAMGIDEAFINVIKLFYINNEHILKIGGCQVQGIIARSGVRQGCPLSGIIFAIIVDVLVRRINLLLQQDESVGAFADDIAVVVKNLWVSMPALQNLFSEFHAISGLALNVQKTVAIPLWKICSHRNLRMLLRESCPAWANISIQDQGKYLGFMVGPGAKGESWKKKTFEQIHQQSELLVWPETWYGVERCCLQHLYDHNLGIRGSTL
jgi:hypothetical protein